MSGLGLGDPEGTVRNGPDGGALITCVWEPWSPDVTMGTSGPQGERG